MSDLITELHEELQRCADSVTPHAYAEAEFAERVAAAPRRRRSAPWRGLPAVLAGVAVVLVIVVVAVLLAGRGKQVAAPPANRTHAPSGLVEARARLDITPTQLAVGQGAAWVVDASGRLERYDPTLHRITARGQLPSWSADSTLAPGLGALWVGDAGGHSILKVDPTSARVLHREPVTSAGAITADGFAVWAVTAPRTIARIDLTSGRAGSTIALPDTPLQLVSAGDVLWARTASTVLRIDTRSGRTSTVAVAAAPTSIAVSADTVWIRTVDGIVGHSTTGAPAVHLRAGSAGAVAADHVQQIAYATDGRSIESLNVGSGASNSSLQLTIGRTDLVGPAVALGSVWVADGHELLRLDTF